MNPASTRTAWLFSLLAALILASCRGEDKGVPASSRFPSPPPSLPAAPGPWRELRYPTDQEKLLEWEQGGALMPSSGEDPKSGSYGSVRSERVAKRLLAAFHEGIDIAPLVHDRRGRAADEARAIAAGEVEYYNRYPGNSDYGTYLVLAHEDPLGPVYSLYAHLGRVSDGIKAGSAVKAGDSLGMMGNTSGGYRIPVYRAHLHLEVALMLNSRFRGWQKAQKMVPDHGNSNGWNLVGIDPLLLYRRHSAAPDFTLADVLEEIPVAFEIVLKLTKVPDYFERYPALWNAPDFAGGAVVVSCSENGLPLRARAASSEEANLMGKKDYAVGMVDERVLGRNGARIVVRARGRWDLGTAGKRWLSILMY